MKRKKLNNLKLEKRTISNLKNVEGGDEQNKRLTSFIDPRFCPSIFGLPFGC